jgi:type I restriction enzyme R subunit
MLAFWSAGFLSSSSTSGRPLTNRMMSGRRVWCGPLMVNWLTASHSFCGWLRPVDQAHKVAPRFTVLLVLHRHAAHQQLVKDIALAMSKAFTLCCTLDEAKAVREEVAFLQGVKVILTKRDLTAQKKTDEERELAIRQIINSAVVSDSVVDIFDAVGLEKPNIGLLDEGFLSQVKNLPERNLAVELLERLLEGEIKSRFGSNVVQERKFSELLSGVMTRYQNRSIETAQVMEELVEMARKFRDAANRGEVLGLSEDEVRFYDALANNESAVRELKDETLKKIAHELTENLRQNLSVDWSERESVRAKLRLMVKRILRKYKYPPDMEAAAVDLILEQAQALGEDWAG